MEWMVSHVHWVIAVLLSAAFSEREEGMGIP